MFFLLFFTFLINLMNQIDFTKVNGLVRNFLNCTIKENDMTDGELPDKDMTIINFEKFM